MKILQETVLIGEINFQSKIALGAAKRLQAANDNLDHIEIWSSIQSILIPAGNISKILWPSRKEYKSRGEHLREKLKVEKDNPLSKRKFRNYFEHYDELIDDWFNEYKPVVHRDLVINPSMSYFGRMPGNHQRGYNSFDHTLLFRGEVLDLKVLLNAIVDIKNQCRPYVLR